MGPLVYYCRWQGAKLRLRGRDERQVWGHLAFGDEDGARLEPFRFDLATCELFLGEGEMQSRVILDKLGVVVSSEAEEPPTTSAAVEP